MYRLLFLVLLLAGPAARADDQALAGILPAEAQIIETRDITPIAKKSRVLVLWMVNAQEHDCAKDEDNAVVDQACASAVPNWLYEDFWEGPTRLSLVDANGRRIVNTIDMGSERVPAYVQSLPYSIPNPDENGEGKPEILNLRDLTGEGAAAQFFFIEETDWPAMGAKIFGYQATTDQVVQYRIKFTRNGLATVGFEVRGFSALAYLMLNYKPVKPGYWNFRWSYGRGNETSYHEVVRFDRKRQIFVDKHSEKTFSEPP